MTTKRKKQSKFVEPKTYRIAKTITIGMFTVVPDDETEGYMYRAVRESDWKRLVNLARKAKRT